LRSAVMRIYWDACVASALAKNELCRPSLEAIRRILDLGNAGQVDPLASSVMQEELNRIPEQYRPPHRDIYTQSAKIPIAATHHTESGMMLLGVGRGRPADQLVKALRGLLPDEADARHGFQAVKNGSTTF
jgi:hypothetical protein